MRHPDEDRQAGRLALDEFLGHLVAGLRSQASDLETAFGGLGVEKVLAFGFGAGWQGQAGEGTGSGIMVVATERGRDAASARPHDTEGVSSMQPHLTTPPLFGDPRLPARFWDKVQPQPNGCWLWAAGRFGNGYSQFWWRGRQQPAHRIAYQVLVGPIYEGLESDHLCRIPACVNPSHIEPVTRRENTMRGDAPAINRARMLAKTVCLRGHPFDNVNTYHRPDGYRGCKACQRMLVREYRCREKALVSLR